VLYHRLEFGKPLAMLYVDDKAITPEGFLGLEIQELKGGWSGESIIRVGSKVFKTDRNINESVEWYKNADPYFYVPPILSVVGNTLSLKYIQPDDKYPQASYESCLDIIEMFSSLPPINNHGWGHYIWWVAQRCERLLETKNLDLRRITKELANLTPPENTFSHGDMTPDNTIRTKKGRVYLIDPRNVTYSSFVIDKAKLDSWALRQDNPPADIVVNALVVAEIIRVLGDCKDEKMFTKLSNICLEYLKN